jgi:hypothetical protein
MKTNIVSLCLLLTAGAALAQEKKDDRNPLPGKAEWDLRAFGTLFKVADTQFDSQKNQLTWTLELKDDVRTVELLRDLDKDRVFQLVFADADMKELAIMQMRSAKFDGISSNEKFLKRGTRLKLTIDLPGVLEKTAKVTLTRVRGQ